MTDLPPETPAWASFFASTDRYRAFVGAVEGALGRRGVRASVDDEAGIVRVANEVGGYGLENLAQRCNAEPESGWSALIEAHLNDLSLGEADLAALTREDLDKVKPLLRVRLHDRAQAPPGIFVGLPVADDLFAALVYELPTSVAAVTATDVRRWGVPIEELLELGLSNVLQEGRLNVHPIDADGCVIYRLSRASAYTATHLLLAHQHVPPQTKHGLIVSCPNPRVVLVHAIGAGPLAVALQKMANTTHGLYDEGPWAITPSLYWWSGGPLERLAIERKQGGVEFTPSRAFAKVLEEVDGAREEDVFGEPVDDDDEAARATFLRIAAVLAETLPITGRRTALALAVDTSPSLSKSGFICPLKVFVSGARDPSVPTDMIDHPTFLLFPRHVMNDGPRCEAALRSALERIAIEIGLAKIPLPSFDDAEKFLSAIFPFATLESKLDFAKQDAAIKSAIKKAFTTVKQ